MWKPFPDRLPWAVYGWAATALLAVSLLIGRWFVRRRDRARPLVATALVVSAVFVVISAAGRIDAVYDAYPTVRTVLGISDYRTVPFDDPSLRASQTVPVEDWSASDDLPATGAEGLRRGRRAAWFLSVGGHIVLIVVAAASTIVRVTEQDETRSLLYGIHRHSSVSMELAPLLALVSVLALLLLTRTLFDVRAP